MISPLEQPSRWSALGLLDDTKMDGGRDRSLSVPFWYLPQGLAYSARSAASGSTDVARIAGPRDATSVVSDNSAIAMA